MNNKKHKLHVGVLLSVLILLGWANPITAHAACGFDQIDRHTQGLDEFLSMINATGNIEQRELDATNTMWREWLILTQPRNRIPYDGTTTPNNNPETLANRLERATEVAGYAYAARLGSPVDWITSIPEFSDIPLTIRTALARTAWARMVNYKLEALRMEYQKAIGLFDCYRALNNELTKFGADNYASQLRSKVTEKFPRLIWVKTPAFTFNWGRFDNSVGLFVKWKDDYTSVHKKLSAMSTQLQNLDTKYKQVLNESGDRSIDRAWYYTYGMTSYNALARSEARQMQRNITKFNKTITQMKALRGTGDNAAMIRLVNSGFIGPAREALRWMDQFMVSLYPSAWPTGQYGWSPEPLGWPGIEASTTGMITFLNLKTTSANANASLALDKGRDAYLFLAPLN